LLVLLLFLAFIDLPDGYRASRFFQFRDELVGEIGIVRGNPFDLYLSQTGKADLVGSRSR
jgi:hypothetical protein